MKTLGAMAAAVVSMSTVSAMAQDCPALETQAEINACAARELTIMEADMAAVVSTLEADLSAEERDAFRAAQAAWRDWRAAQCAFESAGAAGGSAQPLIDTLCRLSLTDSQTARLGALRSCPEGDIACVGR